MARIGQLENKMKIFENLIHQWREHQPIMVPISTLDPEPFELTREITVVVQPVRDEFVASFFDANINASGETQQDAVANLKDVILAIYERLSKEPPRNLGKMPSRQLAILRGLIRRKD